MGWKATFGAPRLVAAVEFDARRLRLVAFRRARGGPRVLAVTSTALGESVDPTDAAAVGGAIAAELRRLKLDGAALVMNLPRGQVILKPLALPAGTADAEIPGMVQYMVPPQLPFAADEAVIDHARTVHMAGDGQVPDPDAVNVMAVAARASVVEFHRQVAAAAGAPLLRLGLRPEAMGRCVRRCVAAAPDEAIAVVDVTAGEVEIDVFVDGRIAFSRSAPVTLPEEGPAQGDGAVTGFDVFADEGGGEHRGAAIAAIVREATLSVQSYQTAHGGAATLGGVLVAGDSGLEDDLTAALAEALTPCERFVPAGGLGLATRSDASAHAALLGAAMIDAADREAFDLLDPKRPVVQRDGRRDRVAAAAIVAILVLAGAGLGGWFHLEGLRNRDQALARKVAQARKAEDGIRKLIAGVQAISDWQRTSADWLGHLAYLSAALPDARAVYLGDLATGDEGQVTFTVRATGREVIEDLRTRLIATAGYQVSPARVAPTRRDPLQLGFEYESTVELRVKPEAPPAPPGASPGRPDNDGSATLLPQRLNAGRGRVR
ncbi:MAG: pilus assembly protein PilM [Planctomycetes bacterium]|nr:pilus assembly protein PilM [Planctomycetota bacterium]